MNTLRLLVRGMLLLVPWTLRRRLLAMVFGYQIHPTARIGLAWVYPKSLVMAAHARIGHLTVCKGLTQLSMGEHALIGRGNWITGYPVDDKRHYGHQPDRDASLHLGAHAAITHRHLVDCTSRVDIGEFATLAGFGSQVMTHSVDLEHCRQSSAPVSIGRYCFVGTNCTILGGAVLPDYAVLGAASLLNTAFDETHALYAGQPARRIKPLPDAWGYFRRTVGYVT